MQGSKYLRVTGILMIIFSVINLLVFILLAGVFFSKDINLSDLMGEYIYLICTTFAFSVVRVILQLIAGIMGVKYHNLPERAQACFIVVVVLIVVNVIPIIIDIFFNNFSISSTIGSVGNFILPVLFLVGAIKNKSSVIIYPYENYNQPIDKIDY